MGKAREKKNYYAMKHNRHRLRQKLEDGYFIVPAHDKVLQLDIDSDEQYEQYVYMLPVVKQVLGKPEAVYGVDEFKSNKGWHIYVSIAEPLSFHQRVALQLMLGSDPMREAMACGIEKSKSDEGNLPSMLLFEEDPEARKHILDDRFSTDTVLQYLERVQDEIMKQGDILFGLDELEER